MKELKIYGMKGDAYLASIGARAYGVCTGHLGELKHDSDLGYIDDLAYFAIGTGYVRALIELLDIAPNYYADNKLIKHIVDRKIERGGEDATYLHLKAQREYAIATALNKNQELSVEENNAFVKNSIRNKHSLSNKISSLHSEIIQLSMCQALVEEINNKITEYEETQKAYNEISNMPNIATVEKCFIDARNAYLEQVKNASSLEDAVICKANAHLIAKDFNLQCEEKKMGNVTKIMQIASKVKPTAESVYYLTRCEFADGAISQREYESRLMHFSDKTPRTSNFMFTIDFGYRESKEKEQREQAMHVYQSTNDVLEDDKKSRQSGSTLHDALNEYANSVGEIGNRKNEPNINNKTFEESLEFADSVLANSGNNENCDSQDAPVSE